MRLTGWSAMSITAHESAYSHTALWNPLARIFSHSKSNKMLLKSIFLCGRHEGGGGGGLCSFEQRGDSRGCRGGGSYDTTS